MCSTTLWARNVSSRWWGCARGSALSTAFALPANWTRMAPALTPPDRRLRRLTSAPTTPATSARTSAGSSSGWVPWFIGSKDRSLLGWLVPPSRAEPGANLVTFREDVVVAIRAARQGIHPMAPRIDVGEVEVVDLVLHTVMRPPILRQV